MEKGEIPKEAINLMRKAMKQRRGSVDNVAETLMVLLAASGQSKESIAKAMVKALQATGATPEEIAKTMQQAMAKSGATQEEICKAMASAMAASGASGRNRISHSFLMPKLKQHDTLPYFSGGYCCCSKRKFCKSNGCRP